MMLALWVGLWPPLWAFTWRKLLSLIGIRKSFAWVCGTWGYPSAGFVILLAAVGQYAAALSSALSAIAALVCWWLSRRRRKRAPKLAGAKSKAILAAVVRTMRERTRPRPVFRPQPQGV